MPSGGVHPIGYAAYNRLARSAGANEGVTLAACFAHVRRRFYELHVNESSQLATQTVTTMAGLWAIEADIRGQDPATRVKARQERSATIVKALFDLWEKELPRLSGKSKLAEAIRYATSRRTALERFLSDGRIELGRVDDWRGDRRSRGFTVSGGFRRRRCRSSHHSSVSSRRSSNRACRFPAPGFHLSRQTFALDRSVRRVGTR